MTDAPNDTLLDDSEQHGVIRIIIADDQSLFVEGLRYILEARASDMRVVATVANGEQAIEAAERLQPDIILMDVRMPLMDGVEATRIIHQRLPGCRILMLTTFPDDEYVHAALRSGAVGYLLKNRPLSELIHSIRAVRNGIMLIDPSVAETLFHAPEEDRKSAEEIESLIATLTQREREVLYLLIQAHDNTQIAESLGVAVQTVRNYTSAIYNKLHIANRMDLFKMMKQIRFYLDRHE